MSLLGIGIEALRCGQWLARVAKQSKAELAPPDTAPKACMGCYCNDRDATPVMICACNATTCMRCAL